MECPGDFVRLLGIHFDSPDLHLDDTWYVIKSRPISVMQNRPATKVSIILVIIIASGV